MGTDPEVSPWLLGLGEVPQAQLKDVPKDFTPAGLDRGSMTSDTPDGRLQHLAPVARLSETPPRWSRPSVPLGYHAPEWPGRPTPTLSRPHQGGG